MFRVINETQAAEAGCTWTNWTDEELLVEYRCTGIREAFEEIVRRYERELYNYLYRYLGNAANAEDVFQKTFLAILEKCDQFEVGREFRPWLYGVATNKAIDCQRSVKYRFAKSIDEPMGEQSDTGCFADTIVGNEPAPFEAPMDREIACKVREAVEMLPEKMRQAIYMIYFQGLTYREAADAVGIHSSSLAQRVSHAVEKLNVLLKSVA